MSNLLRAHAVDCNNIYLDIIEASVLFNEFQKRLQTLQRCGSTASLQYESAFGYEHAALAADTINNAWLAVSLKHVIFNLQRVSWDGPRRFSCNNKIQRVIKHHNIRVTFRSTFNINSTLIPETFGNEKIVNSEKNLTSLRRKSKNPV